VRRASLLGLAALLGGLSAGCAGAPALGEADEAIIGGTLDTGDPAVVMLASYSQDQSTLDTCSASLIAPTVLLTAAHCVDPATHAGYTFGVFTAADSSAYMTIASLIPELAPVASTHAHPDYDPDPPYTADVAVVILETALDVTPLPVNRAPVTASLVGTAARIIGYGETTYEQFNGAKHDATTTVASVGSDDTIVVGDSVRRSCVGDSGGPALVKMDGVETIVGIDSYTNLAGCLEPANYRRPDKYTAFIDMYAPAPMVDAGTDGGGGGTGGGEEDGGAGGGGGGGGTPVTKGSCAAAPGGGGGPAGTAVIVVVAGLAFVATARRRRAR
jgi:V8-like Glu-specific endopeptidase